MPLIILEEDIKVGQSWESRESGKIVQIKQIIEQDNYREIVAEEHRTKRRIAMGEGWFREGYVLLGSNNPVLFLEKWRGSVVISSMRVFQNEEEWRNWLKESNFKSKPDADRYFAYILSKDKEPELISRKNWYKT